VAFKEKKPLKNKSLVDQQKGEKLQCSFEETINDIQEAHWMPCDVGSKCMCQQLTN
jgi:hypothetical protein